MDRLREPGRKKMKQWWWLLPAVFLGCLVVALACGIARAQEELTETPTPVPTRVEDEEEPKAPQQTTCVGDYGDNPTSYRTWYWQGGPYHEGDCGPILGLVRDEEYDGFPSSASNGDDLDNLDDEDGVSRFPTELWKPGGTVHLSITISVDSGFVVGWFDWNNSGAFDWGERVVFGDLAPGEHNLSITIPTAYSTGNTVYARVRVYPERPDSIKSTGKAICGEIEDYRWDFSPTAVKITDVETHEGRPWKWGVANITVATLIAASVIALFVAAVNRASRS